jgi:hypothetical protein
LSALETLLRYERDIEKLKFYKRELDLVIGELRKIEEAIGKRPIAKVLPFAPKKPTRSA